MAWHLLESCCVPCHSRSHEATRNARGPSASKAPAERSRREHPPRLFYIVDAIATALRRLLRLSSTTSSGELMRRLPIVMATTSAERSPYTGLTCPSAKRHARRLRDGRLNPRCGSPSSPRRKFGDGALIDALGQLHAQAVALHEECRARRTGPSLLSSRSRSRNTRVPHSAAFRSGPFAKWESQPA